VFYLAKELDLPELTLLDIGGGFPGAKPNTPLAPGRISFEQIVNAIRPALDLYFPDSCGVKIISEPGRYFVDASMTIFASVIARRAVYEREVLSPGSMNGQLTDISDASDHSSNESENEDEFEIPSKRMKNLNGDMVISSSQKTLKGYMVYINDGLYQSFNCIVYDHATVTPYPFIEDEQLETRSVFPCSVYGPTCDGLDKLADGTMLPELNVGDWVFFANSGAYTFAAASHFNGFKPPERIYISMSDDTEMTTE